MVRGKLPTGVAAVVVMVMVEEVAAGFGENVAVAPEGSPVAPKFTDPEKPPAGVTVTVNVVEPAGATVRLAGEPEREKSGVEV